MVKLYYVMVHCTVVGEGEHFISVAQKSPFHIERSLCSGTTRPIYAALSTVLNVLEKADSRFYAAQGQNCCSYNLAKFVSCQSLSGFYVADDIPVFQL